MKGGKRQGKDCTLQIKCEWIGTVQLQCFDSQMCGANVNGQTAERFLGFRGNRYRELALA